MAKEQEQNKVTNLETINSDFFVVDQNTCNTLDFIKFRGDYEV